MKQRGDVRVRRLRHTLPPTQSGRSRATFRACVLTQRLPWKPDVVLAVVPSLFGATSPAAIARRTGAPLVVWVQDLMGPAAAQSGISGGGRIAPVTTGREQRVMRSSRDVVIVSGAFRPYVEAPGVPSDRVHAVAELDPRRGGDAGSSAGPRAARLASGRGRRSAQRQHGAEADASSTPSRLPDRRRRR
jgi:colanic acid biosynthesis glycosyl transferase WcaI